MNKEQKIRDASPQFIKHVEDNIDWIELCVLYKEGDVVYRKSNLSELYCKEFTQEEIRKRALQQYLKNRLTNKEVNSLLKLLHYNGEFIPIKEKETIRTKLTGLNPNFYDEESDTRE